MTNTLIIIANPREESFSFAIANKYEKLAKSQGHHIEVLDLYREKHQQGFLIFDKVGKPRTTTEMKYFQDKISKADELVFVFPYWWGGMPAILKNFIDWNFSRGFAFEYAKSRPKGLLTNKIVKVFTTTGAPYFFYMITGANRRLKKTFKQQFTNFCGMKLKSFNIYGGIDMSRTNTKKILNKVGL